MIIRTESVVKIANLPNASTFVDGKRYINAELVDNLVSKLEDQKRRRNLQIKELKARIEELEDKIKYNVC